MAIVTRGVISIDQDKCVGCGRCANACMQGAIAIKDGKAYLTDESYCDGIGMCLPNCPTDAITIEKKETKEFNKKRANSKMRESEAANQVSTLKQWPVQMKLVSPNAPWLKNANLLIAADCVPVAYANFHSQLLKDKKMLLLCPKLDDGHDYVQAIANVVNMNNIKSITIAKMSVPCCTGTVNYVKKASELFDKQIPIRTITLSTEDGEPMDETTL